MARLRILLLLLVLSGCGTAPLKEIDRDLFAALKSPNAAEAKRLVAAGANIEVRDERGATPLHWAAIVGLTEVAELLISRGANVNAREQDGYTPLHGAAYQLRPEIVELLVQRGADVNAKGAGGWTPLHKAMELLANPETARLATPAHGAAMIAVVEYLIGHGADVNARGWEKLTPLHYAAAPGQKRLVELLIAKGADVNVEGPEGVTPLYAAIRRDHTDVAELLLAGGAAINARTKSGYSPLTWAARTGNKDAVSFLIARGADVNARDNQGRSPLVWALLTAMLETPLGQEIFSLRFGADAWQKAQAEIKTMKGEWRQVAIALIENGADLGPDAQNFVPLMMAANLGAEDVVRALIDRGADINDARTGETALHAAIAEKHVGVAELLIRKGADVNSRNMSARTPLHFLARDIQNRALAELMIERGADVNARDKNGETPMDFAVRAVNGQVTEVLRQRGAQGGLIVMSSPGAPPGETLTTTDAYLSLRIPPPDRLWTAADYEITARVLRWIAQRNPNDLPRIGSPISGVIFDRLVSRANFLELADRKSPLELRALRFSLFSRLMFPAIQQIFFTYAIALDKGVARWTELVEIIGLTLHGFELSISIMVDIETDAKGWLGVTQPEDADHRKATVIMGAMKLMREGVGTAAVGIVEMLDAGQVPWPTGERLRLIELLAESLPRMLAQVPGSVRREVSAKLGRVIDKETDEDVKWSLQRLVERIGPRN